MSPAVSVVIPAYNNAEFIGETVRSVLAQTFDDFEVVIGDHASTDGTWEVLQEFADDPRVRLLQHPGGRRREGELGRGEPGRDRST